MMLALLPGFRLEGFFMACGGSLPGTGVNVDSESLGVDLFIAFLFASIW